MVLKEQGQIHVWYDAATNLRYEWNPESSHYVNVFVRVRSPEGQPAYVLIDSLDTTFAFKDPVRPQVDEVVRTIQSANAENVAALSEFDAAEGQTEGKPPWRRSNT